jgi:predicted metal-dependent hydrolase
MDVLANIEAGRTAFNRGAYFEAHERWEDAWRALAGAERLFVQGLIQLAAGLHHLQQRRPAPAAELLRKGLEKIQRGVPAPLAHLQVTALAPAAQRLLVQLAAAEDALPDPATLTL